MRRSLPRIGFLILLLSGVGVAESLRTVDHGGKPETASSRIKLASSPTTSLNRSSDLSISAPIPVSRISDSNNCSDESTELNPEVAHCSANGSRVPGACVISFTPTAPRFHYQDARAYRRGDLWMVDRTLTPSDLVERMCMGRIRGGKVQGASGCRDGTLGCTDVKFMGFGVPKIQIFWEKRKFHGLTSYSVPERCRRGVVSRGKTRYEEVESAYVSEVPALSLQGNITLLALSPEDETEIKKLSGHLADGTSISGEEILRRIRNGMKEIEKHERMHYEIAIGYAEKITELLRNPPRPSPTERFHQLDSLKEEVSSAFAEKYDEIVKAHALRQKEFDRLAHTRTYQKSQAFFLEGSSEPIYCIQEAKDPSGLEEYRKWESVFEPETKPQFSLR